MGGSAVDDFTPEEVDRARRYHRPLYRLLVLSFALDVGVLALLTFGPPADRVDAWLGGLPLWAEALAWPAVVVAMVWLVGLPASYWRGFVHEKAWGFSTQTRQGWLGDRVKGLAIGMAVTAVMLAGLVAVARALPRSWPLVVAAGAALVVLFLSFVAPVVLEPLFNRFTPVADPTLADGLLALSVRVGVPIREVLVADASRRTRKENAYVSGLGRTRRVVLFDTLLDRGQREVGLVVAHELGHRRMQHGALGTALGMAGAAALVLVLWALLRSPTVLDAIGATGAGDPRVAPFVLLVAAVAEMLALPAQSVLSRRWESDADRFSLEATGDLEGFERAHVDLARANAADLDPPRLVYLMLFSHPSPPERLAAARRWAVAVGLSRPSPATTA